MLDSEQFNEYYQELMPQVYKYIYIRLGYNTAISEDLVSEIFLKALEKLDTFSEKEGTFKSWIFKITKNHLIDYFRSKKNKSTTSLDEISNILHNNDDPKKDTNSQIELEALKEVLQTLPKEKQELVTLRYISGHSYKEIAEITKKNENKIRVTVHRVLKELKSKLYELDYNPEE